MISSRDHVRIEKPSRDLQKDKTRSDQTGRVGQLTFELNDDFDSIPILNEFLDSSETNIEIMRIYLIAHLDLHTNQPLSFRQHH